MNKIIEFNTDEIIHFLEATDFFHHIPLDKLKELCKKLEWIQVNSGEILLRKGEKGDCLYLVMSGRFTTTTLVNEDYVSLNEIGRGELIGELALLTQLPRSITVIAIRDSILLKLSQESFDEFIQKNPLQLAAFARSSILRLLNKERPKKSRINAIAIVPAGREVDIAPFINQFVNGLKKYGTVLHLNSQKINEILKQDGLETTLDSIANVSKLVHWINKKEAEYRYLVYETEADYTEWTQRCLRQSDRILMICDAANNKDLNLIEQKLYSDNSIVKKKIDLVLLHEQGTKPEDTMAWLQSRQINEYHHLRKNLQTDMERLIRIVSGNAIALILGGGAARALAHVGVYKALNQLGIPVDLVGGTSFGALIGCGIATDLTLEAMIENLKKRLVYNPKLFQRTLPILSLSSGRSLTKELKDYFGKDTNIEDLWKKFFCITCNLTHSREEVIDKGSVWRAIRSSVSMPVIFPPITNAENDVFIDGALINNLPVDIMRRYCDSGKIIAVSTSVASLFKANIPEGDISGFQAFYQRYIKKEKKNTPNILKILLKSIGISSLKHEKEMLEQADYPIRVKSLTVDLLNFKAMDELIECGYRETMNALSKDDIAELLSFDSGKKQVTLP